MTPTNAWFLYCTRDSLCGSFWIIYRLSSFSANARHSNTSLQWSFRCNKKLSNLDTTDLKAITSTLTYRERSNHHETMRSRRIWRGAVTFPLMWRSRWIWRGAVTFLLMRLLTMHIRIFECQWWVVMWGEMVTWSYATPNRAVVTSLSTCGRRPLCTTAKAGNDFRVIA